jgi:peptidoglycan hydrolase-like protein with peptidoglycan-binding domain
MSYYAMNGYGSVGCCGLGAVGGSSFNAEAIWADCAIGQTNNAAGKRCGQAVQVALNALGYGPLDTDGAVGTKTMAAIRRFSGDNGFGTANWPTKAMLYKMEELLRAGQKPGPANAVEAHKVGDEWVPGADPKAVGTGTAKAGMSTGLMVGIGAVALLAVGGLALMAKKKPGESGGAKATANRRRRRRFYRMAT